MDEEPPVKHRAMVKGAVNRESGLWNDVFIINIGGDTNDALLLAFEAGEELQDRIGPIHMPADGILAGEHAFGKTLADEDDRFFRLRVEVVEIAAGENGNAQGGKESGRDYTEIGARIILDAVGVAVTRKLQAGPEVAGVSP